MIGTRFAQAFAAKDSAALAELLHPQIDFRGLTPSRAWEAHDPDGVLEILLGSWIEPTDHVRELVSVDGEPFMDRERLRYRMAVTNGDGAFMVEQQAYLEERDGQIGWMRVLCSGFRPVDQTGSE